MHLKPFSAMLFAIGALSAVVQPVIAQTGSAPTEQVIPAGDTTYRGPFTVDPATGAVNGTGKVEWRNGNRYEGQVRNNQLTGKGKFTWSNGDRYEGDMVNAEPHGQGTYYFKGGDRYSGAWNNGRKHGQGRYTFEDGSYWEGQYANDRQVSGVMGNLGGDAGRKADVTPATPPTTGGPQQAKSPAEEPVPATPEPRAAAAAEVRIPMASTRINYQQEISRGLMPGANFVDFTADASVVASCRVINSGPLDGSVRLVRSGKVLDLAPPPRVRMKGCDRLALSADGELLGVIYGTPRQAESFDLVVYSTADPGKKLLYPNVNVFSFSKNTRRLAMASKYLSGSSDPKVPRNYIRVDDLARWLSHGETKTLFKVPSLDPVNSRANNTHWGAVPSDVGGVEFRPNDDVAALLLADYSKNRWVTLSADSGAMLPDEWTQHETGSGGYAMNNSQSLIAVPTRYSEVALFDQQAGQLKRKIGIASSGSPSGSPVLRAMAFTYDDKLFLSCEPVPDTGKRLLRLTEVATNRLLGESLTDANCVRFATFRFTPDKTLILGSGDQGIIWWPNAAADLQHALERKVAGERAKAAQEAESRRREEQENARRAKQEDAILNGRNPQAMYLAAGKYEREGEDFRARKVYERLIERFPNDPLAAKANDRLLAMRRADSDRSNQYRNDQRRQQDAAQCRQRKLDCRMGCDMKWTVSMYQGCTSRCESICSE